jgi:hypothetical protein
MKVHCPEAIMSSRVPFVVLLLSLLLVVQTDAKNKNKQQLPDYVLQAQTVLVVVHPDASEPMTNLLANREAQNEVESAMRKWGRFNLVLDSQTADLVIAIRKGSKSGPSVVHSPVDRTTIGGGSPVGAQRGSSRPPDVTSVDPGGLGDSGPQIGSQIASSEDTFEVYRGEVDSPLDASPVWRYVAKDALNPPQLAAVGQFRQAVEESDKQRSHKP